MSSINSKILPFLFAALVFSFAANSALAQKPNRAGSIKSQTNRAEQLLSKAEKLIEAGDAASLKQAIPNLETAIKIFENARDQKKVATCQNLLGGVYESLDDLPTALKFYRQSLKIFEALADDDNAALVLNNLGWTTWRAGDQKAALDFFARGLRLAEKAKNSGREALILYNSATAYAALGDKMRARENFLRAIDKSQAIGDSGFEFNVALALGTMLMNAGDKTDAVKFLKQALDLPTAASDDEQKFVLYNNLAQAYDGLGEKRLALEFYQKALDRLGESDFLNRAVAVNNIGLVELALGDAEKARKNFREALKLIESADQPTLRASILNNQGFAEDSLGNPAEAVEYYRQSAEISEKTKDLKNLIKTLNNLVLILLKGGEAQNALEILQPVMPLVSKIGDAELETIVVNNYARALELTGDSAKAADAYQQSLAIARRNGYKPLEAQTLGNLMFYWDALGNRRLAAFFGKQAVNLYQNTRADISNLEAAAQKKYLASVSDAYRKLADVLINLGRLPEAEQILAMIKEEEYFDFVQRDAGDAKKLLGGVELTADEAAAIERYEKIAGQLTQKGLEFEKLRRTTAATSTEQAALDKKLSALSEEIEAATKAFNLYLQQIAKEFSEVKLKTDADVTVALTGAGDLQSKLRQSKLTGTVLISTIITDRNLYLILTTPTVKLVEKSPIESEKLNQLTAEFRLALQNPKIDPRPAGEKLYRLILEPLEKHLAPLAAANGGEPLTLVWSLDETLRYIPLAALWDGKNYVVEKYRNVVFTLASRGEFDRPPNADWRGLGLGVTKSWGDFEALPSVKKELLQGAIRAENVTDSSGVVPGKVLLDQDFTQQSFARSLAGGEFSMIHIASHFSLKPGGYAKSALLLGTGEELTLDKIKNSPDYDFTGVELLTISACNTAIGGRGASGQEIEGFAKLAQDKGARAVMATLWSVEDESTGKFMTEFYRRRQEEKLSKAEAMRRSQLALLGGIYKGVMLKEVKRSDLAGQTNSNQSKQLPFKFNAEKPFSHPYYWSPFVLIGNWR